MPQNAISFIITIHNNTNTQLNEVHLSLLFLLIINKQYKNNILMNNLSANKLNAAGRQCKHK